MEKVKNMNLPIVGKIQHGEQQISNGKKKVVELGYFIAKIKNDNMQFLLNKFNELFNKQNKINIRFFDEEPLTLRRIRYNQGGTACYCMYGQEQAKQKTSEGWKSINCTDICKYRLSQDGTSKPMCNLEGTLKFLLPQISTDRIWIMKITGQTSIKRLQAYIELQKQLGNSLIGDYTLFLKQENQTNKLGKSFNNYILDIVKQENFNSNAISSDSKKVTETFNKNTDNTISNNSIAKNIPESPKENKPTEKKASKKSTKKQEVKTTEPQSVENTLVNNFEDYYVLVETFTQEIPKAGVLTEYLVAKFVDINDKPIDVIIPPNLQEELLQCDLGTMVTLELATKGQKTFTNNINYIQKCLKNVAA